MLSTPLNAFATAYNLKTEDNIAYGVIEGFVVSVFNKGAKKCAFINCTFPEDFDEISERDIKFELSAEITKAAETNTALKDYEISSDGISFTTSDSLTVFDETVKTLLNLLKAFGVWGDSFCNGCGHDCSDYSKLHINNSKARVLCADCAANVEANIDTSLSVKQKSKCLKGSVFAIIGALLCFAVNVSLFAFAIPSGEIFGLNSLIVAIPLAVFLTVIAFLAYRVSTGRKGMERILPCLIVSLLFSAATVYFGAVVLNSKEFGINSLGDFSKMANYFIGLPLNDPFCRSDFLTNMFYSFVAVIIVVLVYSIVFEEKKKTIETIVQYRDIEDNAEESGIATESTDSTALTDSANE